MIIFSGTKLLNASNVFRNDMFDIYREFEWIIPSFEVQTRQLSLSPKSVRNAKTSIHLNQNKQPESPQTCLPWWATKAIKAARPDAKDASIGQKTRSQNQHDSIALM